MGPNIREARASDKDKLLSFIKDVWGGHDYIPRVWDEWLRDKSGRMFVVEVGGAPVGMNRVRFLEDGSAWFEGVRVHPDHRGKGLASMLGENSMRFARQRGVRVYRLTSSSRNRPARRQVARMGFGEIGRFSVYEPRAGNRFAPQGGVKLATPADVDRVRHAVEMSKEYLLGAGVMWDSFCATSLTRDVMAKRVREGSVFLLDGAIGIARPGREGSDVWNQICFLSGKPEPAVKLVRHIFGAREKADWKLVYVPQGSPLIGALRKHGLKRAFSLVLYERKAFNG